VIIKIWKCLRSTETVTTWIFNGTPNTINNCKHPWQMMTIVQCTSEDLGSLVQQRVPSLLIRCWNSLHDHHKSHWAILFSTNTLSPRGQKLPQWNPTRSKYRYRRLCLASPTITWFNSPRLLLVGVPEECGISQTLETLREEIRRRLPPSQWTRWPRFLVF
jgi:hypothetical protein